MFGPIQFNKKKNLKKTKKQTQKCSDTFHVYFSFSKTKIQKKTSKKHQKQIKDYNLGIKKKKS